MKTPILKFARILLALLTLSSLPAGAATLGTAFTYQGRLNDGGSAASGSYDLRFELFTLSAGGVPTATVTNLNVAVSNGLFTTAVDFGAGIFNGTAYWLELASRTNGGGAFTVLVPRQELTPSPHAIYASGAGIADGAVTSAKILDGTIANADLGANAVTTAKVLDGTLLGADLANNTVTSAQLADSIDLGSSSVNGLINIYRNATGTPALILNGADSSFRGYGSDGAERVRLLSSSTFGGAYLYTTNGSLRAYLLANAGGGVLQLYQADGGVGAIVDGDSGGSGRIELRNTNASTRINLYGQSPTSGSGGEITVHDNSGTETVELLGQATSTTGGKLTLNKDNGAAGIVLQAEESDGRGGRLALYNSTGSFRAEIDADDGDDGGAMTLYAADGSTGLILDGESGGAGLITVYNTNNSSRVVLDGQSTGAGGEISVRDASGTETIEILGAEDVNTGGQILMRNAAGTSTIQLDSDASGNGSGYIRLYKSDGSVGITLEGDNAGDGRITTQELQITGGSDLSEQFDINSVSSDIQPGMVVSIDAQRPGELVMSTRAYDRTVAGVVSGAGGVKPGMLMGQRGTKADGKHPVALTGRVYCLVDASSGAIRPGDLLTTSNTPGHAMKVMNHSKAQGAIIGKAMTALDQGKGLVLVLVSLQ